MRKQQEEFSKRSTFQNEELCIDVKHRTERKRKVKYFKLLGMDS